MSLGDALWKIFLIHLVGFVILFCLALANSLM